MHINDNYPLPVKAVFCVDKAVNLCYYIMNLYWEVFAVAGTENRN